MARKIFVIENSPVLNKALRIALKPFGAELKFFSSFEQAKQYLNICDPHLLVVDSQVLEEQRQNKLKTLKSLTGDYLIMVLSSVDENFSELGGARYVHIKKPFSPKHIREVIPFDNVETSVSQKNRAELDLSEKINQRLSSMEREAEPELLKQVNDEIAGQIPELVKKYCEEHFRELAKEVIREEINKIVESDLQ